jgi:predicted  nucleic acid-binding Zn-ribbon protein
MSVAVDGGADVHEAGERTVAGSLTCLGCGYSLTLSAIDQLPVCPACGGNRFRRHRLFEQPTMDADAVDAAEVPPAWLEELRGENPGAGFCLAFEIEGEARLVPIDHGWTRIGRSGSADIQLDDPTVSRRHALIVRTPGEALRALDDRSLNGLFVNGEKVDWIALGDGDELEIGRYRLYVLEA